MSALKPAEERSLRSRLFVPFLMLVSFSSALFAAFFSTDLLDIARTLHVSVGTTTQLATISNFLGLFMGIATGFLAVRFKHRSLYLLGLAFGPITTLLYFFAPNFFSFILVTILGAPGAIVGIVGGSMVGDFLPLRKKGMAIGLIVASGVGLGQLIMPQVTSVITNAAGWRYVILWFIFPISLATLLFGFFLFPSNPLQNKTTEKPKYSLAFKQILTNKSAISCQVAGALMYFSFVIPLYGVTFYRLHFHMSLSLAAVFYSIAAAMALLGAVVAGRLINPIGRRRLAVVGGLFQGIFAVLMVFVPNIWSSLVMYMVSGVFAGVILVALSALGLEQVPSFRGTMVSISSSFHAVGYILGLAIAGLLLNVYVNNFQIVYTMFGVAAISSAAVIFFFAKDPCIKQVPPPT